MTVIYDRKNHALKDAAMARHCMLWWYENFQQINICPISLERDCISTLLINFSTKKAKKSQDFQQIIRFFFLALSTTQTFILKLCSARVTGIELTYYYLWVPSLVRSSDNSNNVDVVSKVTIICALTFWHRM